MPSWITASPCGYRLPNGWLTISRLSVPSTPSIAFSPLPAAPTRKPAVNLLPLAGSRSYRANVLSPWLETTM